MENETQINDLKNRLSALESKLKAALQQDDPPDVSMPMRGSLFSTFHGEMRRYAILTWCFLIFFAVGAAGCFVAFDMATTTKYQLLFMTLFTMSIMQTVLMKLWYWQIWNRYSVVREVKRLELRIVELTEKLEKR
jgi:hypothetical protein